MRLLFIASGRLRFVASKPTTATTTTATESWVTTAGLPLLGRMFLLLILLKFEGIEVGTGGYDGMGFIRMRGFLLLSGQKKNRFNNLPKEVLCILLKLQVVVMKVVNLVLSNSYDSMGLVLVDDLDRPSS
jgi:hypothetical protein